MNLRTSLMATLVLTLGPLGCAGKDGVDGVNGQDGANGLDGENGLDGADGVDGVDGVDGEDGEDGVDGEDGEDGEDATIVPADASGLDLIIESVESTMVGKTYDVVMTFSIYKNGVPYVDFDGVPGSSNGLPNLDQSRFYAVEYDEATQTFDNSIGFDRQTITGVLGTPGQYTISYSGASYAPEASNAIAYAYVADEELDTEASGSIHLYDFADNAALAFGTAETDPYQSPANVSGCESCHGTPYMKHGYRAAEVEGISDFAACKACHYDTKEGGHQDWQILVDDPLRYSEIHNGSDLTEEEETYYAYTANVMNDVHMSHAMEFPYPQSMANCVTCHEGKLDEIQADEHFTIETCRSCHVVTGSEDYETAEHSLTTIWDNAGVSSYHSLTSDCAACHVSGGAASGVLLSTLHNGGYDPMIYTADGVRYSDAIVVNIDDASFDSETSIVTIEVSVDEVIDVDGIDATEVSPDVRVGLYAYDAKDFHAYVSADEVDNGDGTWTATADLSSYAADISADGKNRRIEVVVRPTATVINGDVDEDDASDCGEGAGEGCAEDGYYCDSGTCVEEDDQQVAPIAPSRTFELADNAFVDGYYPDIVDVEKCNACHDTLATTFHSPNRSGNIAVCKMCHKPNDAGSHLEMQSRSLDTYVHAIHSFQAYDPGDIDFDDPVEAMRYELHVEHGFPNFTIKNCMACHNEGMFEVPDQSVTLPGKLSAADTVEYRDITGVESTIVGPGARACGGCHRSHYINEDDFSGLVSFNAHTKLNGYGVSASDVTWDSVLATVMGYFGEDTSSVEGADVGPETCQVCHDDAGVEHQAIYNDYADTE